MKLREPKNIPPYSPHPAPTLPCRSCAALFNLLLLACALLSPAQSTAAPLIIDDFSYTNTAGAQSAWNTTAAPEVEMATGGEWGSDQVMILPCDFATREIRCRWDRSVPLDLSRYVQFELEVFVPNPGPISSFTLYFRSGVGWYAGSARLAQPGWQTLRFTASNFIPEGTPAGWNQIDGIRLSPWKAASENTYLAVRQLRAITPTVLLVRDTASTNPEVVQQTIDRHLEWLDGYNITCGIITRADVKAGLLQESKLAILPYNESVSEAEMLQYENFVASGGKLVVHYLLRSRLAALLGVRVIAWTPEDFAAWLFSDPQIPELPSRVLQASWNITHATTNGTLNGRITARWEDTQGQNSGKAAWIASDHGFFMSHILLGDDPENKSYALLCLLGSIIPDVWPAAAAGAIAEIGKVGPFLDYTRAVADIRAQAAPTLRARLVEDELARAETNRVAALAEQAAGRFSQAVFLAQSARACLKKAYSLSLKPVYPEFRAIWEHHATGPYPGDWPAAIAALATNQINAVFPNMLRGGLAHYNSAYLPHSSDYLQYGDQITACVNAAHARGVQVHVWKVNWNLAAAPQSFIDAMRAAGRTQVSSSGAPIDWLCPSHPDNLALETNSMIEIVRNYDVDGIHFDYIRYPDADSCYCPGCGSRFQSQTGLTVPNWPADVLAAGSLRTAFLNWRRAQITRLVEAVYIQTKALKPSVQVSAAVFSDAPSAYDSVGQDWRLWVTNGILDFVCPMDYTTSFHTFTNLVAAQLRYVDDRIPVYPGIGAYVLDPEDTLAQLQATRAADTEGFIIFELSPSSAATLLPAIGSGATANDEPDMDNDLLPDAWEQRWFTNLTTAALLTDKDGDGFSDRAEYIAGTDPTTPSPFTLQATSESRQIQISFCVRGTEQTGYRNATRHYRLESTTSLDTDAVWSPVPGYSDLVADPGVATVTCTIPPNPDPSRFYRIHVWLQER